MAFLRTPVPPPPSKTPGACLFLRPMVCLAGSGEDFAPPLGVFGLGVGLLDRLESPATGASRSRGRQPVPCIPRGAGGRGLRPLTEAHGGLVTGSGGRGPLVTVVAGAGARQGTGSASSAPTRRRHRLRRGRWSAGRDRRPRPARIEPRSSLGPPPRRAPESPCNGIIQQDPPGSRNPSRSPALRRNASI